MWRGVIAGLAAGALWGLVFVVPAWLPAWPPVDLAVGRMAAYAAVSLGVMLFAQARQWVRSPAGRTSPAVPGGVPVAGEGSAAIDAAATASTLWPTPRQALAALGLSFLGFWGYYTVLVLSLRDAGPELPTLIIGTIPLWVMVLGKPGHLRWRALLPGLLFTAAGLGLMAQAVQGAEGLGVGLGRAPAFWRGVVLALLAMAFWTVFALLNAAWLRRHPEVSTTAWANWLGLATGVGTLGLWAVAGSPLAAIVAREGAVTYLALCAGTGFGAAWVATILWNQASRRLSASLCGQLIVSETLFALLYAFLLEGRWPTPAQGLAAALFTLGILASIQAQR